MYLQEEQTKEPTFFISKCVPQNNPKRNPPPNLSLNFNPPKWKCYHLYQSLHHTLHETFHRLPFFNMSTQPTSFLNNNFCRYWPHFSFKFLSSSAYETKLLCTGSLFHNLHMKSDHKYIQPRYDLRFKHWCSFSKLMKLSPQQFVLNSPPSVVLCNASVEGVFDGKLNLQHHIAISYEHSDHKKKSCSTTLNMVFSVTYYLESRNAKFTYYIYLILIVWIIIEH